MPIKTLTHNSIVQTCAHCKSDNTVSFDDMVLGGNKPDPSIDRVIKLPACGTCGTIEFLLQGDSPMDGVAVDSPRRLQRGAINRLWKQLLAAGRAAASTQARLDANPLSDPPILAAAPTSDPATHLDLPSGFITVPAQPTEQQKAEANAELAAFLGMPTL